MWQKAILSLSQCDNLRRVVGACSCRSGLLTRHERATLAASPLGGPLLLRTFTARLLVFAVLAGSAGSLAACSDPTIPQATQTAEDDADTSADEAEAELDGIGVDAPVADLAQADASQLEIAADDVDGLIADSADADATGDGHDAAADGDADMAAQADAEVSDAEAGSDAAPGEVVDDAALPGPCPGGCDDKNGCTTDICDDIAGCEHVPSSDPCDDGDPCSVGDACAVGLCQGGPAKDCDDKNPCTTDTCAQAGGACSHLVTKAACDDGNPCTINDFCWGNGCSGQPMACDDGNACTQDTCVPTSGCKHVAIEVASGCDDLLYCTKVDICVGGVCFGSGSACDDQNPCTVDSCKEPGSCSHTPFVGPCDDGISCTEKDHCVDSSCKGAPTVCDDANPCTSDSCEIKTGNCLWIPGPGPCDDGNFCTSGEQCQGGVCSGGSAKICNSGACFVGKCDPASGACSAVPKAEGAPCGTLSGCQSDKVCSGGACTVGQGDGCDDGNPCTQDVCDNLSICKHVPMDGDCSDGDPCTGADHCSAGSCLGTALACDDDNPCTAGSCSPSAGACVQKPTLGIACSDGNPCTVGDLCSGGACLPGLPLDCDDGKKCTSDDCSAKGCGHTPLPNGAPCDDGNVCTVGDACIGLQCGGAGKLACSDGNSCTADWCEPGQGCQHAAQNLACDDGDCCTAGDHCAAGACTPDSTTLCDDGVACTIDSCLPGGGCHFAPDSSPGCGVCSGDDFEGAISEWSAWSDDSSFVQWLPSTAHPRDGKGHVRAVWKGPAPKGDSNARMAHLQLRKILLGPGPAWLAFDLSSQALTQGCSVDTLHVAVNGKELWKSCNGKPGEGGNPLGACTNYQHVVVPLTGWVGAPIDIDLRLDAGAMAGSGGTIDVDNLQVYGSCEPACLGMDLEQHDAGLLPTDKQPPYLLPAWPLVNSAPNYLGWKRVATGGHTGIGTLQAQWAGLPPGPKQATSVLTWPAVTPSANGQLSFWYRAIGLGDPTCGGDDLEVLVAGKQVFTRCDDQANWAQVQVDLAPWVGQSVAIELRVRSADTTAAAGVVQVDDVAIRGNCSYRCLYEDFSAGAGEWQVTQTKGSPGWVASSDAYSPPLGMAVDQTASAAPGAKATLSEAPLLAFVFPAHGGTWRARLKVDTPDATCPSPLVTARGQVIGKKVKGGPATGPGYDMGMVCQPLAAWTLFSGELPMGLPGRDAWIQFVAQRPLAAESKVRIDDIEILCH